MNPGGVEAVSRLIEDYQIRIIQQGFVMFSGRLVAAVGYIGLGSADSLRAMKALAAVASAASAFSGSIAAAS